MAQDKNGLRKTLLKAVSFLNFRSDLVAWLCNLRDKGDIPNWWHLDVWQPVASCFPAMG